MSSKEEILARIRQNTGTRYEKPDIAAMKRLAYPDKIEQFCAVLSLIHISEPTRP